MAPSDIVYCDQCGGASPLGSAACRFCGATLPPPRTATRAPVRAPAAPPPAADDDPWADLTATESEATPGQEAHPWVDPEHLPWRAGNGSELPPTVVHDPIAGTAAAGSQPPPSNWTAESPLIEPGEPVPRRGLPGWAWVASVVVLGTLLGIGAYVVVDRTDDGSTETTDTSTTSTTSSSTSTTSTTTTTVVTTAPPTTLPVVPATPPATAPVTGPPTVPGAVITPTTLPPTTSTLAPTTLAPTTTPPTPAPTTAPPTTPAPTTPPPGGTVPGDLGIPGIPMSQPACDGKYVTFLASVRDTTGPAMQRALESFPGSSYLRTNQTCPSLNMGASDGAPLYRIFAGPYANVADACAARSQGAQGSFVKRLSNTDPPTHVVTCP